jgi:hypothetical protein
MQHGGGATEVQPLGHRDEIPQLPYFRQIHTARVLQPTPICIGSALMDGRTIAAL